MKVKELIVQLQAMNPDSQIEVSTSQIDDVMEVEEVLQLNPKTVQIFVE